MSKDCFHCALLAGVVLALVTCAAARAEEPTDASASEKPIDASALEQAKSVAKRLEVRLADATGEREIVLPIERPLLLFGDDPRNLTRGILWGWGAGRPVAVAELWRGRAENSPYAVSLTLTGPDMVAMTSDGKPKWEPAKKQMEFMAFADAPVVAAKESARLRQIKEMARRFEAHEFWDPENSRFELRLLVQPVHRYSDMAAEIQDGALFVFAHGTNPEAILFIEAFGPTTEKAKWQYGLVRTSNAESHVELDGREVWMQPRVKGGATRPVDPYFVFSLPPATFPTEPAGEAPGK